MTGGLIAVGVALACAIAGGVAWRRGNGRMRNVGSGGQLAADAGGLVAGANSAVNAAGTHLTAEQLGEPLGDRATLVQFSTAFCAPCRATRRVLAEVAGMTQGVAFIELDAEAHLGLVRSLNVLRTPTVLVTDSTGLVVKRASGQPRKPDVIAALGHAVGVSIPSYTIGNEDSDSGRGHA